MGLWLTAAGWQSCYTSGCGWAGVGLHERTMSGGYLLCTSTMHGRCVKG